MNNHSCLLCLGSNLDRHNRLTAARQVLANFFPDIRFGTEMETEAIGNHFLSPFSNQLAWFSTTLTPEEIRTIIKGIEKENGRAKEDKAEGIVKLDIDLLMYDERVLKPDDLKKDFIRNEIKNLKLPF